MVAAAAAAVSKAVLKRALNSTAILIVVTEFQLEKDMSEIGDGGEVCSGGKWTMPRITIKKEKTIYQTYHTYK